MVPALEEKQMCGNLRLKIKGRFILYLLPLTIWISIVSCTPAKQFRKTNTGLIIPQTDGTLAVTVYSDRIIRVTFAPKDSSSPKEKLAVIKVPEKVNWTVKSQNSRIILETNETIVKIDADGTVGFYNKKGGLLLSELPGSRKLVPSNANDIKTLSPEQGFKCIDEGLYGMGQFQDGLMNWKNVPLRLKQFNQEIAVPFLVSTEGYGLYWDNCSVTEFNPPEKEILLNGVVDAKQNVRKASFTPSKTGTFCFAVESINDSANRFAGPVLLTIDGDTVIHYNTTWVPEFFSGKKSLIAGRTYNIEFTNSNAAVPGRLLYNEPDYNKTIFRSSLGSQIDYYFINGGNIEGSIANYRTLTGQAPLFGKWAYGFWQCRERYHSQAELLENAAEYRKRQIPVDNIVQDWNYWPDKTWGPEWNRKLYPDPAAMCQHLKVLNFHLMVSVWPCVRNKGLEKKYGFTNFKLDTTTGNLDFYNSKVRTNYYRMLNDSMFSMGVNSIWLDGTEPEVYPLKATTALGPYDNYALTYSLPVTRSVYEGRRIDYPQERVFNLTRSAFAGQQRYAAACWSGDVKGTWEQFAEQIPAGLNFSMAGLPYWTTDIGGFFRDSKSLNPIYDDQYTNPEYIELLTRWFQFGTFCPIFRIHGYVSNTEVWRYGAPFEKMARQYIDLRYQLMPYIYSSAWKVTNDGAALMKPLLTVDAGDKNTWNIKDQYLFGESILVSPVTHYQASNRNLYLPKGKWFNFWTNEMVEGGRTMSAAASIDQIPLFIKAGSIIPIGPKVQYAMQPTNDPLKIVVYPGASASFVLYEDEGESYRYEKGEYTTIPLVWNDGTRTLTMGQRAGHFNGMTSSRKFEIIVVGNDRTNSFEQKGAVVVDYNGESRTITIK